MSGVGNGKFAPNLGITRGMLVTVLYGLSDDKQMPEKNMFNDIPKNLWYAKGANWAASKGLVSGIGNGAFGGDMPLSREQLITVIYQYAKKTGKNIDDIADDLGMYSDSGDIADYALIPMKWAKKNNLLDKISDSKIQPKNTITRGELAVVLESFINGVKN